MKKLLIVLSFLLPLTVLANFVDTKWEVVGFVGEKWQSDMYEAHKQINDKNQYFEGGYAKGFFYNCNYEGQSKTYNTYDLNEFLNNKEMENFKIFKDDLQLTNDKIFVHRITCAKTNDVIYPFVTQDNSKKAYYPFEGGIFILENKRKYD